MTNRQKFVRACEALADSSAPDPLPLIAFADWLDEQGEQSDFAMALRWMARTRTRPLRSDFGWTWMKDPGDRETFRRAQSQRSGWSLWVAATVYNVRLLVKDDVLPLPTSGDDDVDFKKWTQAVRWLAARLRYVDELIHPERYR